jgi:hypothetical protein
MFPVLGQKISGKAATRPESYLRNHISRVAATYRAEGILENGERWAAAMRPDDTMTGFRVPCSH